MENYSSCESVNRKNNSSITLSNYHIVLKYILAGHEIPKTVLTAIGAEKKQ